MSNIREIPRQNMDYGKKIFAQALKESPVNEIEASRILDILGQRNEGALFFIEIYFLYMLGLDSSYEKTIDKIKRENEEAITLTQLSDAKMNALLLRVAAMQKQRKTAGVNHAN